jgi:hypothetical protein
MYVRSTLESKTGFKQPDGGNVRGGNTMRIEDQVCSFEQAVKLSVLMPESLDDRERLFYWEEDGSKIIYNDEWMSSLAVYYPAYTVAELGVLLPISVVVDGVYQIVSSDKWENGYRTHIGGTGGKASFIYETEAESRAYALIWLIENGHIKAKDLKL